MTMAWLFGDEIDRAPGTHQIQPRVYDIDIVHTVYRMMLGRAEKDLAEYEASPAWQERSEEEEWSDVRRRHVELEDGLPKVYLSDMDAAGPAREEISIDAVRGLESHDRKRLQIQGAGLQVVFHHRFPPYVSNVGSAANHDLTRSILALMKNSGRRRPQRYSLIAALPIIPASILTALGVWTLVDTKAPASLATFVIALLVILWVPAIWASWRVNKEGRQSVRAGVQKPYLTLGHRFREGNLSDVRDRITNARATAMISLVTVPVGAVIGWFLKQWLG